MEARRGGAARRDGRSPGAPGAATRTAPTARDRIDRLVWCPQPHARSLLRGVAGAATRPRRRPVPPGARGATSGATTASASCATSRFDARRRAPMFAAPTTTGMAKHISSGCRLLAAGSSCRRGRPRVAAAPRAASPRDGSVVVDAGRPGATVSTPTSPETATAAWARSCCGLRLRPHACSALDVTVTSTAATRPSTSAPAPDVPRTRARGLRRGHAVPQPAPDAGQAAGPVAAGELRARAAGLARGRLPVPRGGPRATRRTSGCSRWPRCATSTPSGSATGEVAVSRGWSGWGCRRWPRCGPSSRRFASRERPVANRLVLDVGAPWDVADGDTGRCARPALRAAGRASGAREAGDQGAHPGPGAGGGARDAVLTFEGVGGAPRSSPSGSRRDRAGSPAGAVPAEGADRGALRCRPTRTRSSGCSRTAARSCGLPAGSFAGARPRRRRTSWCRCDREPGTNTAHLVVGLLTQPHRRGARGDARASMLLSDPTQGLGNLAEPECRRVNAALDLRRRMHRLPVEWFAVSQRGADRHGLAAPRTWTGSRSRCAG